MRLDLAAALVVLALVAPAPAWPQTDAAQQRRDLAQTFVDQVAATDELAVWTGRICPVATGFPAREALRLLDRIRTRASDLGLREGAPGCAANLVVIGTPDSDALARAIVSQRLDLLGYRGGEVITDEARTALDAFAATPRPVRSWYVVQGEGDAGRGLNNSRSQAGRGARDAVRLGHAGVRAANAIDDGASMSRSAMVGMQGVRASGSRLRQAWRPSLDRVLIVVDTRRVAGAAGDAWMDYVAMAALARLNPDAQAPGVPTILDLFAHPETAPLGLSDWDAAYLRGLYQAAPGSAHHQRAQIAARMAATLPPS